MSFNIDRIVEKAENFNDRRIVFDYTVEMKPVKQRQQTQQLVFELDDEPWDSPHDNDDD